MMKLWRTAVLAVLATVLCAVTTGTATTVNAGEGDWPVPPPRSIATK